MRKLITLSMLLLGVALQSQEQIPSEVIGIWQSQEGEFVKIEPSGRFVRVLNMEIQAQGRVELKEDQLYIIRADSDQEYSLCFFVGNETMVVCKPKSTEAWLFNKVGEL